MKSLFDLNSRQIKLNTALQKSGLDAIALNPGPSLVYLTGLHFHLSERPIFAVFLSNGNILVFLPELEMPKVYDLDYSLQPFSYKEDPASWQNILNSAIKENGLESGKIGIEPLSLRFLELDLLQNAVLKGDFLPADDLIASLRIQKDETEIECMQQAVEVAQVALEATLPMIKPGITEEEIARELSIQLIRHGSNPHLPFFPIVSSGSNSANPHAAPSSRALKQGDLLVIDYGANVQGYVSDITRTFAIGQIDPKYSEIAQIVLEANQAGRSKVQPGVTAGAVDKAARSVIEEVGYGKYFVHRTGHGVGLEGHEPPYIRSDNQLILKPGMAFTIEPGIYIPNENGVRIEDNVIVTSDGIRTLTSLPRELITLPL